MATVRVTGHIEANLDTLFTVPAHKKAVLDSVDIDNQSGAQRTVYFRDVFTPSASVGTPSPAATTRERFQTEVANVTTAHIPSTQLEGIQLLGTISCYADATNASLIIIVNYHFE